MILLENLNKISTINFNKRREKSTNYLNNYNLPIKLIKSYKIN